MTTHQQIVQNIQKYISNVLSCTITKQFKNLHILSIYVIKHFDAILQNFHSESKIEELLQLILHKYRSFHTDLDELQHIFNISGFLYKKYKKSIADVIHLCSNYFDSKIQLLEDKLIPDILFYIKPYIYTDQKEK